MKTLLADKKPPLICTPLTGSTLTELENELKTIVPKQPDLLEWRADFFHKLDQWDQVTQALKIIKKHGSHIPLLVTIRSVREGGQPIPLTEEERIELICKLCKMQEVQLIDIELSCQPEEIRRIRDVTNIHQKSLILSYHDFERTPAKHMMLKQLLKMEFYGADAAKIAVMPHQQEDVLSLLEITHEARQTLSIPVISISMGELGLISRIFGWYYGAVLTFAVGESSSAPGQMPIETMKQILTMLNTPKPRP